VQTETATLLAVLAAPLAVVAAVFALAIVSAVRRSRRELVRTTARLETQEGAIRDGLIAARAAFDAAGASVTRMRGEGGRLDADVAAWTLALIDARTTLRSMARGRLGPMVRAVQVAGALARIALLWRAPAR
jgi:hypothetical protein